MIDGPLIQIIYLFLLHNSKHCFFDWGCSCLSYECVEQSGCGSLFRTYSTNVCTGTYLSDKEKLFPTLLAQYESWWCPGATLPIFKSADITAYHKVTGTPFPLSRKVGCTLTTALDNHTASLSPIGGAKIWRHCFFLTWRTVSDCWEQGSILFYFLHFWSRILYSPLGEFLLLLLFIHIWQDC